MPKSYRIRTEVGVDKYINVNLEQDWESLEVLSLKILANDLYTRMCADYGVVVGRVFVNNGFGLPNAKVSVFIPLDNADEFDPVISELYPYRTITDTNEEGYRYNLLPKLPSYKGHQSTGTFPNIGDVLMDESFIEVYDKYYRFTVTTNDSGDFMIFGVPTGTQTIVMDVDLSDIGCFSLSPQDLIQQGLATETQVNGSTFRSSTNLRELPQIKNLVFDVDVAPFWGDQDLCQVGITRVDFDLTKQANINIQPTSVFMGSIISTTNDDALKIGCKPKNNTGNLCELVAGPGEIQAIRQTINSDDQGLPILEVYQVEQEGKVIDPDGTYVLNVPMNLDYVFTNEFGEQVLSDDPSKGIPTKGKYRFKMKWQNEEGLQNSFQRANFLVPNVKEYGWSTSGNDPFDQATQSYTYQIQAGLVTGATEVQSFGFDAGISFETSLNNSSYEIYLNGVLYTGSQNSIPFNVGDTIQIVGTSVNPNVTQDFTFKVYPETLFNLLKSYAFSLDWDDYVNPQEAIDCEDTFYEFKYNKVYTTAMFLDRYKNGIGRARHLGIKEIDNRACKSTVNTFPVNDIIRNFDPIFFVFNILINILTFPLLVLLFVAHFISFMWPILKYVLIVLSIYLTYDAAVALFNSIQNGVAAISAGAGIINAGLPSVNVGWLLEGIRLIFAGIFLIAAAVFKLALAAAFLAFTIIAAIKVKGFPRISLPMIAYPDCTSCDCDCKTAEMDDNFDLNSVNDEIEAAAQGGSSSFELTLAPSLSIIAPVNSAGSYDIRHPNISGPDDDPNSNPLQCGNTGPYKTFASEIADDNITSDLAVQASLDLARVISGYDVLSSTNPNRLYDNEQYLLHAPQPFLWAADKPFGLPGGVPDYRFFAFPLSKTFPQQLNDFNTRDKYFNIGGAINQVETTVNPTLNSQPFTDQVVVVLMSPGAIGQIGIGNVCSFQDPNYTDAQSLNRLVNLTGATLNQFGTNSITGTTLTGNSIPTSVQYANPSNPQNNLTANIVLNLPQVSQQPVNGNPNVEQSYLQYSTDIEYFQLVTGLTVSEFVGIDQLSLGYFPNDYLRHSINILTPDCPVFISTIPLPQPVFSIQTINSVINLMEGSETYEICIFVRGVDPFTPKQTIKYDLSKIFGFTSFGSVTVEGSYYLNRPIQGYSSFASGNKPVSHVSTTNNVSNLYFPSFAFTPDTTKFTAFTSNLPYYYLCTDDTNVPGIGSYTPVLPTWQNTSQLTTGGNLYQLLGSSDYTIPKQQSAPTQYVGGNSFLAWNLDQLQFNKYIYTNSGGQGCDQDCQKEQYYNTESGWFNNVNVGGNLSVLYSPVYYRYGLTPVTFQSTNIVMRSDRLPTSTNVENGVQNRTGYALHQNNNFTIYTVDGTATEPTISAGFDLPTGDQQDEDPFVSGLTNTLTCEGMVPLECYSGSGSNVGVIPPDQCSIPANRMVNGCYCLLNKTYLAQYGDDARLFLEWKVRFTMNFAACRGVFAQVFQNNWLNGALYMFSFNKSTTFGPNLQPNYNYCEDVIVFNDLSNSFYYRSSPWNGNNFIGKNSPSISPFTPQSLKDFPGFGYNKKQIQFPTTVVDLGPRDSFINEICCSGIDGFGSYYADQLKSTSYQDNSDLIQLGFLSRILNEGVRQRMIPVSTGGDSSEGKGIIQFFNSTRGGYRIDGDWAQMLSINSEWKVLPFITENVPSNDYIFFGDNYYPASYPSNADIKPVFGVFFQTPLQNLNYRKIESPGIETYSNSPLIQEKFGYSKSQVVPHYKWSLKQSNPTMNIFGTEDNNWLTDNVYGGGFFSKKYQDLDFDTLQEKYITQTTKLGYISNYTGSTNDPAPQPPISSIIQGQPIGSNQQAVVVGAPYHFYFGLNNGKTAVDRFYKLYVATTD